MNRSADKLVESYYSDKAADLKLRSSSAGKIGMIAGILAFCSFASLSALMLLSFLGLNPLDSTTTYTIGILLVFITLCSTFICWIYFARSVFFRSRLTSYIEDTMKVK